MAARPHHALSYRGSVRADDWAWKGTVRQGVVRLGMARSGLNYTLACLTHGDGAPLDRTLNSFFDKVKPKPALTVIHWDGPGGTYPWHRFADDIDVSVQQRGFCRATQRLWRLASEAETEFVFWLEHDFRFLRPVDLQPMAYTLDQDASLAQMQLMRNAVSVEEIAAGGLFEMRREDYEFAGHTTDLTNYAAEEGGLELAVTHPWLRHRSYFTTNPSLMRTEFMVQNPWPDDDEPFCEGRFSIGLVERGFHYGVWGNGEPWVQHHGQRTGFGY